MTDLDLRIAVYGIYEFTVLVAPNRRPWVIVNSLARLDRYFPWFIYESGVTEWACTLFRRGGVCESSGGREVCAGEFCGLCANGVFVRVNGDRRGPFSGAGRGQLCEQRRD